MSMLPVSNALHVLRVLPAVMRREMTARGLSIRAAAEQTGVPKSVLGDMLNGTDIRVGTAIKLLAWLDTSGAPDVPDTLTPAARATFELLTSQYQLGQAWLRVEPNAFGLLLPDGDGTLGELTRVRGLSWATWSELEALGLVRRGLPTICPPARGPRNRNSKNEGWPVEIVTVRKPDVSVMFDPTIIEGDSTE